MEFINTPSTQPIQPQPQSPAPPVAPAPVPTPPAPPTVSALSTVVAAPVPKNLKREIRARRGRSTLIFTVLVALLVAAMFFSGIYSMPDGGSSKPSLYAMLAALGIAAVWRLLMSFLDFGKPKPMATDWLRVNEVYEQGAMSTSEMNRVVIPFDEVTAFVETQHWLALCGKTGEIVWSASDLTPAQAQNLLSVLSARLPQTVFTRKASLLPCKPLDEAPPPAIDLAPALETLPAAWSAKAAVARGFAAMLKRGAPLFFLMSMALANALCDGIGWFSADPFAGRLILMVAGALLCAGLGWGLVAWEQTTATRAANQNDVRLHLLADGVRIQDGAEFTVIPRAELQSRRDKNGALNIPLGNRVLTVAYPVFSRSTAAHDFFKS